MTYFVLSPIDTIPEDSSVLLAWAEIWAFISGQFSVSDLELDKEVILKDLSSLFPGEDIVELAKEPGIAWERTLEEFEYRIVEEAKRVVADLPFRYPFSLKPESGIILRSQDGAGVFGAWYLAMQLERLYRYKLATFWDDAGTKESSDQFLFHFRRIFESISAIAVANKKGGVPILLGESRSVEHSLLPALAEVCAVVGAGEPKTMDQLNDIQKQANDAGIDAIVICRDEKQVFDCVVVGATTQQGALRSKVVDVSRRNRLNNYFLDYTALGPQSGVLTHSNPFDDGTYAICNESQCSYLARETILQNLRECRVRGATQRRSYLRSVKASSDPLNALSKFQFLQEFSLVQLPCAT